MKYSVDTSALIGAWIRHYPPDVFPAVWEQIADGISNGKLRVVSEVYREIEQQSDELFE